MEFHIRTGATAISWPLHKAEPLNLTIPERKLFAEAAVKVTAGRVPVSIHVSSPALEDTMERGRTESITIPAASCSNSISAGEPRGWQDGA